MKSIVVFAALSVLVLAVGLSALAYRWQASPPVGARVAIINNSFAPTNVTIPAGTTVRWFNMDGVQHTVTFSGAGMNGMGSGMMGHMGSYGYTFKQPGTYHYYCAAHPSMVGTVTVTP